MRPNFKLFTLFAITSLMAFAMTTDLQAKSSKKWTDAELKTRAEMIDISRQLGVTCAHCHDTSNLKSPQKRAYKVAKEHLRVTRLLNDKGFKGKPKVTCYMCHRGKVVPDYKESH